MLKHKPDSKNILLSIWLLLSILILFGSLSSVDADANATYYASNYNILNGTYFSGSVPASLQTVDSDYFMVRSSPSATSASTYNPSAYSLFGSTAYVSGTTGDLVSDNDVHMVYQSYPSVTSAKTLYAHQETTTIGGNSYYIQKPENADLAGTTLLASMATTGRQLLGSFVYPLMGISSIPASTWTKFYRTWRDPDPSIAYDSAGSGNNGDGTANITWTHVVGSGTNRLIVMGISIRTVTVSVINVTIGGQLATFLRSDVRGTEVRGEIWYLVNPNPGPKTVTVRLSGTSKASGGSVSYTGIDQTNPIDNHRGVLYGGEDPSISLTTTVPNDWIFSNLAISGTATAIAHGSGQAHRFYEVGTGGGGSSRAGVDGDDKSTTAPSSYVMFWNMSFWVDTVAQAVALKPAPSPVGHINVDILILKWDGATRTTIATNAANSGDLTSTPTTVSGTYSWAIYTIVNQTDYLEIDYYVDVTAATSGIAAYLRIDDSSLPTADQTRVTNIMLPSEYTVEIELTGASNTYSWTQLLSAMDSAWTIDAVTVTLQLYNYTLSAYPTSGNGFISYTSGATANTDETKTQIITTNPQHFCDAVGNWRIKVKGVKTTNTPFDFRVDWIEFRPTYYNEYTVATEFLFSSMTTNTPTQLSFAVVSEYGVAGVSVTIQVWNYSSSAYASSGQGYLKYTASGMNETKLLSINTNQQFYTSNGNAKIRIIGVLSTTTQYQLKTNQIKLDYSYVTATYTHDVAVISVTTSATDVISGQVVNVTVVVKNNGTETETFNATLFYNETMIETKTVTNLAPGDQKTLEFSWNTTGLSEARYRINAEVNAVSDEADSNNNQYASNMVKVRSQTSFRPFDWVTPLLYMLPVPFVLLFLWVVGFKRKKTTGPHIEKKRDAFSAQFGMRHNQMMGKKMLLEIDPTSDYNLALSSFVSEAKNNDESLFIVTSKYSTLHSVFSEANNVEFLLLTSKTSSSQQINRKETLLPASDLSVLLDAIVKIQKVETKKTINLLFDNLSDLILRCGFEKTYKFTRFLLEAISSSKITAVFVFNTTAHDRVIASSIRGLFKNQLAYTTRGPKVGTLKVFGSNPQIMTFF